MKPSRSFERVLLAVVLIAAALPASARDLSETKRPLLDTGLRAVAAVARPPTPRSLAVHTGDVTAQSAGTSDRRGLQWGIAIGVIAAATATAVAAASYGENEGGRFCTRCFLQWSVISIPVGGAAGAGVGYLIDLARR